MSRPKYDLLIIGSGSSAFAAAIGASRLELSVLMVEQGVVGGTCVNVGCIPSKALLAAGEARHQAMSNRFPGITTSSSAVDMAKLIAGKSQIVTMLREEKYEALAGVYGFEILSGRAEFVEGPAVVVNGERIEAEQFLIATGSSPWIPPIEGVNDVDYLTSTTAMELQSLPESMIVIGGNAIGLEQGQLFAKLGCKVTIIETLDRIAPFEEPEISQALTEYLRDESVDIIVGAMVTSASQSADKVEVTFQKAGLQHSISAQRLLIATGRRSNTANMGLDKVGVKLGERGEVVVDEYLQSSAPNIWAAGDVTGHPQFVYVAGNHGSRVVKNAFEGAQIATNYDHMPRVTFTSPAIASVGLTDEAAIALGYECECRVLPLIHVPRAIVNRDTRGLAKVVADAKTNKILGIHLLAEGAGDVILAAIYALEAGFTVEQLANTWCPYLTMGEAIKLAAQTFTSDVAKLSCCAV